jgi:hypothetical protein
LLYLTVTEADCCGGKLRSGSNSVSGLLCNSGRTMHMHTTASSSTAADFQPMQGAKHVTSVRNVSRGHAQIHSSIG